MGITILGISNVNITTPSEDDKAKYHNDEHYIYYDSKTNKMYSYSEKSKCGRASRSYSGIGNLMRNLYKYSKDKGIQYNMVHIAVEGDVFPSGKTFESQLFLNEIHNHLLTDYEEDETALEKKYGIEGWDVEFTGLMLEAFKLCNEYGILRFL